VKSLAAPSFAAVSIEPRCRPAAKRDKRIRYDAAKLPQLDPGKQYGCSDVITQAMKVFAQDARVASIDSDLASTSGLFAGISWVDARRALNVGVAEANMMCIGEAYAAVGFNTWVSTFCPFFNFNVFRRIAISQQERLEAIEAGGWLSQGHQLDLTFLATAANFDTRTNGATHMGNDDALVFGEIAQLRVIDVSCPNQMLAIMKWIMEGERGLLYVRIMRAASAVLYPTVPQFEFAKGYTLRDQPDAQAVIFSSGRQVHDSLQAAQMLADRGISVSVVDMPSFDEEMMLQAAESGKLVVLAEQNNGILYSALQKAVFRSRRRIDLDRILAINTLDRDGKLQFIHSAEYDELLHQFDLAPERLSARIIASLK
jgi:transketolase